MYFYPRPPRGGRRVECQLDVLSSLISIHALREEGDKNRKRPAESAGISIHALREEGDFWLSCMQLRRCISIHALREEGDGNQDLETNGSKNFYPRPPRGGRRGHGIDDLSGFLFLSTPSARRATVRLMDYCFYELKFLSTPSARRATASGQIIQIFFLFLSTPSARRATC